MKFSLAARYLMLLDTRNHRRQCPERECRLSLCLVSVLTGVSTASPPALPAAPVSPPATATKGGASGIHVDGSSSWGVRRDISSVGLNRWMNSATQKCVTVMCRSQRVVKCECLYFLLYE
jgi:hypothetical protein